MSCFGEDDFLQSDLNNPAFYDRMSALLEEIIAARKARAVEYEEYLRQIAELVRQAVTGHGGAAPKTLDTPGKRALYDNLSEDEELALRVHSTLRETCPDDWRGVMPREQTVKSGLYGVLHDKEEVERIFKVVYSQKEY